MGEKVQQRVRRGAGVRCKKLSGYAQSEGVSRRRSLLSALCTKVFWVVKREGHNLAAGLGRSVRRNVGMAHIRFKASWKKGGQRPGTAASQAAGASLSASNCGVVSGEPKSSHRCASWPERGRRGPVRVSQPQVTSFVGVQPLEPLSRFAQDRLGACKMEADQVVDRFVEKTRARHGGHPDLLGQPAAKSVVVGHAEV